MIMPIVNSISGLRATLGDSLKPELILNYAAALGNMFPHQKIVVGRDGRKSGIWIESIVAGALSACGCEVVILGIVPTPTVQLAVEKNFASAGISITASHNPAEWNGLKFINKRGIFFNKEENQKLWSLLENPDISYSGNLNFKDMNYDATSLDFHIFRALNLSFVKANIYKIKERRFRVVVDAVNASGSKIVPEMLKYMNCEVIKLYCDNSGNFPHNPEPLAENLSDLIQAVKNYHADLGIAVDPDTDRLVLIDNKGRYIGEEKTIAHAMEAVLSNDPGFAVVNYSTTSLTEKIAEKYKSKVVRCPVGEINVVNKMIDTCAIIGGEGSGGVILPECHAGRDAMVGIALTLSLLAQKERNLAEIVDDYPEFYMIKTKQEFVGSINKIVDDIKKIYQEQKITVDDGIRIDFPDKWVQLRTSNTEPIIRIIAEADEKEKSENLIHDIKDIVDRRTR